MDLISSQRWTGNDGDEDEDENRKSPQKGPQKSEEIIAKLLKKAEKRRAQRLKETRDEEEGKKKDIEQELKGTLEREAGESPETGPLEATAEEDDGEEMDEEKEQAEQEVVGFTVIGETRVLKRKRGKDPVAKWIERPILFETNMKESQEPPEALSPYLSPNLIQKMTANGIVALFPVQRAVIPFLSKLFTSSTLIRPQDICVSSPTGSGKTLSFVLPIIECLQNRVMTEIRVLIVVPVRDLAIQVYQVLEDYAKVTSLRVGVAVGQRSFREDVETLVQKRGDGTHRSLVDILVSTPGRLLDLVQRAPGFDLSKLQILVLDEADRMMNNEMEHNLLQEIDRAVYGAKSRSKLMPISCLCGHREEEEESKTRVALECLCPCSFSSYSPSLRPVHKLLFSATLSSDPVKLESMNLFQPKLFVGSQVTEGTTERTKNMTPKELHEHMIITTADNKPLVIWYLIESLGYRRMLCFTGSIENTHRLYILLKQIEGLKVAEFASNLPSKKRENLLKEFSEGKVDVVVCSDLMARGMDVQGIDYVVCYDPPSNETSYIHRIGRTARAGKEGVAVTLLTAAQIGQFQAIIRRAHHQKKKKEKEEEKAEGDVDEEVKKKKRKKVMSKEEFVVKKMEVNKNKLKPFLANYRKALVKLEKSVAQEKKRKSFTNRLVGKQ